MSYLERTTPVKIFICSLKCNFCSILHHQTGKAVMAMGGFSGSDPI
ncbi:hypothetical protein PO124_26435 [Bacillus licheniformis]|nr:hypothetical protein [Bacillus licheniformis]